MTTETTTKQLSPDYHGYLSMDEIIAYGLPYKRMPEAKPCKFCEKLLEPTGMVFLGEVIQWRESDCDCEQAQRKAADKRRKALTIQRQIWAKRQEEIDEQKKEDRKTEFTLSELQARNYPLDPVETPKVFVCEFCEKETEPIAINVIGFMYWKPAFCDCERGKAKHEANIAEQKRIATEEEARKRQAKQDEWVREKLGESGIKNRFLSRTFDNFLRDTLQREKAYIDARYYADNFTDRFSKDGTGLYIEGTFGTGKTHLAVAIALHLIRQGVRVVCKTSIDLLMDIKAAFKYEGGEEEETEKYKRCSLLVIDDLGKEQCTDWSLPKLYEIINDRYEKCKPTIVTTNYSHDELIRRLVPKGGDNITAGALVSRLKEAAIVLNMVWNDYREGGK